MNEQAEDDILTNPDDLPGLVQSSSGDSDGEGNATSVSMDPQIYGPRWFSYSGGGERSYSAAQLDKRRWEMDQSEMRQGLVRAVSGEGTIAARYHRCATLSCRCCARGARASVGQERDGDGPERNAKRASSSCRRRGDHRCTGSLLCDLVVSVLREKRSAVVLVLSLLVIFHAESLLAAEGPRVGSSGGAACTNPGTEGGIPCADAASSTTTTYHSSEWEKLWLDNIGKWQDHGICEALANQTEYVHAFMRDTCCAKTDTPWCLIDDSVNQYWYHSLDGRLLGPTSPGFEPPEISRIEDAELRCTAPRDTKVWSWFERRNVHTGEVTVEYIEPLVSHLRHPLALCGIHGDSFVESFFVEDKSYVLPGTPGNQTQYLFDAGSSLWSSGLGGPSLSYFAEVWQRSGFDWAQIEAWDGFFSEDEFYASVPPQWQAKTIFHQEWIAAHHGGVFLPFGCVRVPCICVWGMCFGVTLFCTSATDCKQESPRLRSQTISLHPSRPALPAPFVHVRAYSCLRARGLKQLLVLTQVRAHSFPPRSRTSFPPTTTWCSSLISTHPTSRTESWTTCSGGTTLVLWTSSCGNNT